MQLYKLNESIENFEFQFDEETGEVTNCDYLDQLKIDRDEKIESICLFIKNKQAMIDARKNEIKNLQGINKSEENQINYLKNYLMVNLNGQKFETSKVKVSYRKSKSVEVLNDEMFCIWATQNGKDDWVNTKITQTPNKTEIKKALSFGLDVEGCKLVENKSVIIK